MRVFFLRDHRKFPVACVASELLEAGHENEPRDVKVVVFALSTWNAKADKGCFRRSEAKKFACGRLKEGKFFGSLELHPKTVKTDILTMIARSKDAPSRARKAAQYRLENPGPIHKIKQRKKKGDDQLVPLAHA